MEISMGALSSNQENVPNTMEVAVSVRRAVVVNDDIDSFDIYATTEDVGGNKDALLERLKCGVTTNAVGRGNLSDMKVADAS